MRSATMTVARWFGITAGVAGAGHGYYEILQGNMATPAIMISSIGPPCVAEQAWNGCEPAMTIVPNYLVSGVLSLILGLLILTWSIARIQGKWGGAVLMMLSILLLLLGGGFFPPLIGLIGGLAGLGIHRPIDRTEVSRSLRFASRLWPWPLVIFLVWTFGQILVGALANEFMQSLMVYGVVLILAMLPLSVVCAYARDIWTAVNVAQGGPTGLSRSSPT
jgi:hypothetical protein